MKNVAVIGAGLSGVTIASLLKKKFRVKIFEKSLSVGGRMSTRKEPPFIFDHGAQYFKIENKEFRDFLSDLLSKKIIRTWNFKCAYFEGNKLEKIKTLTSKDQIFVGVPNMDSIVKYLSKNFDVIVNTKIEKIVKKKEAWYLFDENNNKFGKYDWIILSLPAEQSLRLSNKSFSFYDLLKNIKMKNCFSLMIGLSHSPNLNYDCAIIKNKDIAWLAVNNSKPLRPKKFSILSNSSFEYAEKNINTPRENVLTNLLNETQNLFKKDKLKINFVKLHHWMYVETENSPKEDFFIDHERKIAVCGDWFINSRVEGAYLSASRLSKNIL